MTDPGRCWPGFRHHVANRPQFHDSSAINGRNDAKDAFPRGENAAILGFQPE